MKIKELNKNTKKARYYIDRFLHNKHFILEDCYNNYSYQKDLALQHCTNLERIMKKKYNDTSFYYDGGIISYNNCFFTYAFTVNNDLYIITYCNNYVIKGAFE